MSRIKLDTNGIASVERMLRHQENNMLSIENSFNQILSDLNIEIMATEEIKDKIIALKKKAERQTGYLNEMASFLVKAMDDFIHIDTELANQSDRISNSMSQYSWTFNEYSANYPLMEVMDNNEINKIMGITHEGYAGMQEALEIIHRFLNIQENGIVKMSEEWKELYEYLQNNDPSFLFGQYAFAMHFLGDLKWYDELLYSTKMWKDALVAMVSGKSTEQMAQVFMNNPDECKAILRNVIDSICQTEYLDIIPSDGEAFLDIMQEAAEVAGLQDAKSFMSEVRGLIGDVEIADKILKDYGNNVAMLQSIKETLNGGSVLDKTIDGLIFEYENQVTSMIFDDIKSKAEKGIVNLTDYVTGLKFSAVDTVLQTALDDVPALDAINTVVFTSNMKSEAIRSFREAAKVVQSGNFTAEDVTTYKNTFNLAKALTVEEYKGMKSYYASGSREAKFLGEQIKALKAMDYANFNYAKSFQ